MATVEAIAAAISRMEGYDVLGSLARRNNNPGNLRWAKTQARTVLTASGKFAAFNSALEGWQALYDYILDKAQDGLTLRAFVSLYAPPTENNTELYLDFMARQLNASPDETLTNILEPVSGADIADVNAGGVANLPKVVEG